MAERSRRAEKIHRAARPSAKSAKTSLEGVLSVLALPYAGGFAKFWTGSRARHPWTAGMMAYTASGAAVSTLSMRAARQRVCPRCGDAV
jgi:hypothetical protein